MILKMNQIRLLSQHGLHWFISFAVNLHSLSATSLE